MVQVESGEDQRGVRSVRTSGPIRWALKNVPPICGNVPHNVPPAGQNVPPRSTTMTSPDQRKGGVSRILGGRWGRFFPPSRIRAWRALKSSTDSTPEKNIPNFPPMWHRSRSRPLFGPILGGRFGCTGGRLRGRNAKTGGRFYASNADLTIQTPFGMPIPTTPSMPCRFAFSWPSDASFR
jgi:hypothetical protein